MSRTFSILHLHRQHFELYLRPTQRSLAKQKPQTIRWTPETLLQALQTAFAKESATDLVLLVDDDLMYTVPWHVTTSPKNASVQQQAFDAVVTLIPESFTIDDVFMYPDTFARHATAYHLLVPVMDWYRALTAACEEMHITVLYLASATVASQAHRSPLMGIFMQATKVQKRRQRSLLFPALMGIILGAVVLFGLFYYIQTSDRLFLLTPASKSTSQDQTVLPLDDTPMLQPSSYRVQLITSQSNRAQLNSIQTQLAAAGYTDVETLTASDSASSSAQSTKLLFKPLPEGEQLLSSIQSILGLESKTDVSVLPLESMYDVVITLGENSNE